MHGDLGTAEREGEVPADVLEQPRGQPARRRADLPVRARATSGSSSACRSSCARVLGWSFWQVGTLPGGLGDRLRHRPGVRAALRAPVDGGAGSAPDGAHGAAWLAFVLAAFPAAHRRSRSRADVDPTLVVVVGLIAFGVVFALNSAVHSYLILAYADGDKVAMNVGFYYMANAGGRLAAPCSPALLYQWQGSRPACGLGRVRARRRRLFAAAAAPTSARASAASSSSAPGTHVVVRPQPPPLRVHDPGVPSFLR